jgi:hypothetical protein
MFSIYKPSVPDTYLQYILILRVFCIFINSKFRGFWYPANKICISLVYIIGTNIETEEKKMQDEHIQDWI